MREAGGRAPSPVLTVLSVPDGAGAGREDATSSSHQLGAHRRCVPRPSRRAGEGSKSLGETGWTARSGAWDYTGRGSPEMRRGWGPRCLALSFALLAQLTLPGDGNEGSITGSCPCDEVISSGSPLKAGPMGHLRKHVKVYHRCASYVRFQLPFRSVCGGSKDQWVQELMSCFDRRECGHAHFRKVPPQEHLPPPRTLIADPTEEAPSDMGSPGQMYLPPTLKSTQQPTIPARVPSLDKQLTHTSETTTSTASHSLGVGPGVGENQKQLKENVAGPSAMVPVLCLLAIVFVLTGALLYVLCKRRRQLLQYSPDLQLHYAPVAPDSTAGAKNGSL